MKIQWLFMNANYTTEYADDDVPRLPSPGDGKFHKGTGYRVHGILSRFTTEVPLVVAEEHT